MLTRALKFNLNEDHFKMIYTGDANRLQFEVLTLIVIRIFLTGDNL
jgi:hypothetical protein